MRQFEIHMPDVTARKLWDRLDADGLRDCGRSMVIVEFDDLDRATDALHLAEERGEFLAEIYPVRGM